MANKILIPTPLRPFTGKQDAVEVDGTTIGELLANLTAQYAGLKPHLYNEQGKLVRDEKPGSGGHTYWVTAVDSAFNESEPSNPVGWTP